MAGKTGTIGSQRFASSNWAQANAGTQKQQERQVRRQLASQSKPASTSASSINPVLIVERGLCCRALLCSCKEEQAGTEVSRRAHQLETKGVAKAHQQARLQSRQQALEQHPAAPKGG